MTTSSMQLLCWVATVHPVVFDSASATERSLTLSDVNGLLGHLPTICSSGQATAVQSARPLPFSRSVHICVVGTCWNFMSWPLVNLRERNPTTPNSPERPTCHMHRRRPQNMYSTRPDPSSSSPLPPLHGLDFAGRTIVRVAGVALHDFAKPGVSAAASGTGGVDSPASSWANETLGCSLGAGLPYLCRVFVRHLLQREASDLLTRILSFAASWCCMASSQGGLRPTSVGVWQIHRLVDRILAATSFVTLGPACWTAAEAAEISDRFS